jgi:hypothetical protein
MGQIDKSKFAEGCRAGNGSYIENPDGTFQCNTSGGITIKCDGDDHCWIQTRIAPDAYLTLDNLTVQGTMAIIDQLPAPKIKGTDAPEPNRRSGPGMA